MIDLIDTIADMVIVVLAGWLAFVLGRAALRRGDVRTALLAVVFGVIALTHLVGLTLVHLFDVSGLSWLESDIFFHVTLVAALAAAALALTTGRGWREKMAPARSEARKKAA